MRFVKLLGLCGKPKRREEVNRFLSNDYLQTGIIVVDILMPKMAISCEDHGDVILIGAVN